VDIPLKDAIAIVISVASLLLSGYAIWAAQFNRGRLKMTQPTLLALPTTGIAFLSVWIAFLVKMWD
jgi:hypothetical protein